MYFDIKKFFNRIVGTQSDSTNEIARETDTTEYSGPDTSLASYLQYYSTLEAPGYAVLVSGPWGVGKTYQVKQVIPESKRYYVSLYGLESVNSIHEAVLASTLPSMKLGGTLSAAGEVGKSMGDGYALAGLASGVWSMYLRQRLKPDRTIIFDDLERSSLWGEQKSELLGAVNHYAEHLGFRVVVICHEERISEELAELKEKTFGHTVKAAPQTVAAVEAFLREIKDETAKSFVTANLPLITEIWGQSEQSSLRILKHAISDITRLRGVLTSKHLENKEAMDHLLRFFFSLNIEVRAGHLNHELLLNRMERHIGEVMRRNAVEENKQLTEIISRYPSSDLTGKILSDEIIVATLIEGRFDAESIASWLDQTPYFIQASDADPWRIVMHFDELDDVLLDKGIALMQRQFDERSVTNMGEFLHVAALRLMMAEQNASGRTLEEESTLCLGYIDDLLAMGKMPACSLVPNLLDRLRESYDGFTYWVSDITRPYFTAICQRLDTAQRQALEATYPEHAADILRRLRDDQLSVLPTISITNSGNDSLANIPIMVHIPPKDFVDAWLSGSRNGWRKITMALDGRYGHGQLERNLRDERPWLVGLKMELDSRINEASGLSALRLERIRPDVFDTV